MGVILPEGDSEAIAPWNEAYIRRGSAASEPVTGATEDLGSGGLRAQERRPRSSSVPDGERLQPHFNLGDFAYGDVPDDVPGPRPQERAIVPTTPSPPEAVSPGPLARGRQRETLLSGGSPGLTRHDHSPRKLATAVAFKSPTRPAALPAEGSGGERRPVTPPVRRDTRHRPKSARRYRTVDSGRAMDAGGQEEDGIARPPTPIPTLFDDDDEDDGGESLLTPEKSHVAFFRDGQQVVDVDADRRVETHLTPNTHVAFFGDGRPVNVDAAVARETVHTSLNQAMAGASDGDLVGGVFLTGHDDGDVGAVRGWGAMPESTLAAVEPVPPVNPPDTPRAPPYFHGPPTVPPYEMLGRDPAHEYYPPPASPPPPLPRLSFPPSAFPPTAPPSDWSQPPPQLPGLANTESFHRHGSPLPAVPEDSVVGGSAPAPRPDAYPRRASSSSSRSSGSSSGGEEVRVVTGTRLSFSSGSDSDGGAQPGDEGSSRAVAVADADTYDGAQAGIGDEGRTMRRASFKERLQEVRDTVEAMASTPLTLKHDRTVT